MALIQVGLMWLVYAVVLVLVLAVASVFVFTYQKPGDRSASVTAVTIITLTALLATVLLLPVDVALVSSTTSSTLGQRKDWASQGEVDKIVYTLKIVYYTLYSADALLCLLVVPFTYFWYEEYDEVEEEEGNLSTGKKFWDAFKYTIAFIVLVLILFLVGFFVPVARNRSGKQYDFDFFKHLLAENRGERALTFALGLLITLGTLIYTIYTGAGFAFMPIAMIKSAPGVSAPSFRETTVSALVANRERQRQIELRNQGRRDPMPSKDRRELDALVREERTLVRRERLAAEASGEGHGWLMKAWMKVEAIFRPAKLLGGLLFLVVSIFVWVSMLLTGIDKAKNSICKERCGYILAHINVFNPINWIFVTSAKLFPLDYAFFLLLVLFFFSSSIVGLAIIGIRVLWLRIFQIRKGHTPPQAMLMATVMLILITLAINYSIAIFVAPQYATFGPQTFCNRPARHPGEEPDCSEHRNLVIACTELAENPAAKNICTPSVASTFLNRITLNFPFFGAVNFWAQFVFLGVFLLIFLTSLSRTPKLNKSQLDEDAEEAEEESLLTSTGRRFGATWQDITGRARRSQGTEPRNGTSSAPVGGIVEEEV